MPVGVVLLVVMLIVLDPEPPLTEVGLKLAVAPLGSPDALKLTESVNPPDAVRFTV